MPTKSDIFAADLNASLRSRTAVIWITTNEEARVERYIAEACKAASYIPVFWDCAKGVTGIDGRKVALVDSSDLTECLEAIAKASTGSERRVWVLRDLHKWLEGPVGVQTCRQLRNLARSLPGTPREAPRRSSCLPLIRGAGRPRQRQRGTWPSPDREEIAEILISSPRPTASTSTARATPRSMPRSVSPVTRRQASTPSPWS
jgi:hypothetical protein